MSTINDDTQSYDTLEERLDSFCKWPRHPSAADPELLAAAGFYYCGDEHYTVRCHSCDMRRRHWRRPEDPWRVHAIMSPMCAHVVANMGEPFVVSLTGGGGGRIRGKSGKVCGCDEGDRHVLFDPCGHVITCTNCPRDEEYCRICTMYIHKWIELYYS